MSRLKPSSTSIQYKHTLVCCIQCLFVCISLPDSYPKKVICVILPKQNFTMPAHKEGSNASRRQIGKRFLRIMPKSKITRIKCLHLAANGCYSYSNFVCSLTLSCTTHNSSSVKVIAYYSPL